MEQDWKDMLASLAGDVPQDVSDTSEQQPEEPLKTVQKSVVRVILDRKGRKGKTATIIEGLEIDDEEVEKLASELKRKIGTGGSARGGEILLQGDWRDRTIALLKEKGYNAKA